MKIGNLLVNAAYLGERVLTAIAVGAAKVWEGVSKYIKFADPVVEQLCMKWSSDGIGLTPEDAAKVTDIGTTFLGNKEITSFEEFASFGVKDIIGFGDCSNLQSITIPAEAIVIKYGAFARSGLTSIVIPNKIIKIEGYAFVNCNNMESIVIGDRVESMDGKSFGCPAKKVYINSLERWINLPFDISPKPDFELYIDGEMIRDVVIPPSVKKLRSYVFKYSSIEKVSFEGIILEIDGDAFSDCALTEFVCPNGVLSMNYAVFPRCKSLKTLDLSNYNGDIGNYFCIGCSTLSIVKLGTVTSIGAQAFNGCNALQSVLIGATTPPTLGSGVFSSSGITIYVPDESVEAYKSATNWSAYADYIKPLSEYVEPTNE